MRTDSETNPLSDHEREVAEGRIAQVLRDYAAARGLALEKAAAKLGISRSNFFNLAGRQDSDGRTPRASHLPSAELLWHLASATGDSIDWMLGRDNIERKWAKRAVVGSVADALFAELLRRTPAHCRDALGDPETYGSPGSAQAFVADVVATYRQALIQRAAAAWRERLSRLVDLTRRRLDGGLFDELSAYHEPASLHQLLELTLRRFRQAVLDLSYADLTWDDVDVSARRGWGFGYRIRRVDHAISVNSDCTDPIEETEASLFTERIPEGSFGLFSQNSDNRPPYVLCEVNTPINRPRGGQGGDPEIHD